MTEQNIKPILGLEAYQAPVSRFTHGKKLNSVTPEGKRYRAENLHLILLAQTQEGLRNLWRMNTMSHADGAFWHHGRVDWELLEKYSEGIICTSACMNGLLPQALISGMYDPDDVLNRYLNIFGDRFYIELCTYGHVDQQELNTQLVSLAEDRGIPLLYSCDSHYARQSDYDLHETILNLQYNVKQSEYDQGEPHHLPYLYIMDEEEVRDALCYLKTSEIDEAIGNSDLIADSVTAVLPEIRQRTPVFIPDKGYESAWDMLFSLVQQGYEERVVPRVGNDQRYIERLAFELEVIYNANLINYFLIVQDYIQWARKQGIAVGPGRGSSGGSLVAFCLGITQTDPIKYDLLFERFYNRGREGSLPDIDSDFSRTGRELVKEFVSRKYGKDYVSDIGTSVTMHGKGAIDELGRIMELPYGDIRAISTLINSAIQSGIQPDWAEITRKIGNELVPYRLKYPKLFEYAERLYGHIRAYGTHASGVIIGDEPLADIFPLRWAAKDKKLVTQWDYEIAQDFGYMKMDFLGLRTLDTLEEVNLILEEEHSIEPIEWENLQYLDHPEKMWEMLENGLTIGLFQIEDGAMAKKIAQVVQPRSVEDLAFIQALNRPGPLEAGGLDQIINYKKKGEIPKMHPLLWEATKDTYGILLYQEQIIRFMELIGYTLEEADEVRALMGKKKVHLVEKAKAQFLTKASQHMSTVDAETIWFKLEGFSRYAFNKAHATCYGLNLLSTLYAKYNYPVEFMLACIRTVKKDRLPLYYLEANRMGIDILPPKLNKSQPEMSIEGDAIRFGYREIKGFGKGPSEWLVRHAPFSDLDELSEKIAAHKTTLPNGIQRVAVTSRHLDILRDIGALDDFIEKEGIPLDEQIAIEDELLGFSFSDESAKILEKHREEIEKICTPMSLIGDGNYRVAGIITDVRGANTKDGKPYGIVQMADIDGNELKLHIWEDLLRTHSILWRKRQCGIFDIYKNPRGASIKRVIKGLN